MLSNLYQVQKCDEVGDISKVIPKSRKVNTKVNTNVMRKRTKLDMKMNEESNAFKILATHHHFVDYF